MSLHSHDEISWFCIKETSAQPSFCFCSLFAEGAGDTTMHTMVYKGPQKTTTKTKNFSVIHDIFTRNCVIYFM